jgi:hypothetical protein
LGLSYHVRGARLLALPLCSQAAGDGREEIITLSAVNIGAERIEQAGWDLIPGLFAFSVSPCLPW